jgi:hypothetical protein
MGKKSKKKQSQRQAELEMNNRKDEIIRRAAQINPPIPQQVLAQLPAFQSAIRNTWTLSDREWGLLNDRLQKDRCTFSPSLVPMVLPESGQKGASTRCEEIARRVSQLEPPIPKSILEQLPAYEAAHNIRWPLMEAEWPILRNRLLDQFKARNSNNVVPLPSQRPNIKSNTPTSVPATTGEYSTELDKRKRDDSAHQDIVGSPKKKIVMEKPATTQPGQTPDAVGVTIPPNEPTNSGYASRSGSEVSMSISVSTSTDSRAASLVPPATSNNSAPLVPCSSGK